MKIRSTPIAYVLRPLVGVQNADFGMTRKQVAKALGKPDEVEDDDVMESINEKRDGVLFEYSYEDKRTLGAVIFPKGKSLVLEGRDLMATPSITEILKKMDRTWNEKDQYINFPKLGLSMGGFGKRRIPEGRLIIAYGRMKLTFYRDFGAD